MKTLLLSTLLVLSAFVHAQSELNGIIRDENNLPLAWSNIVLYQIGNDAPLSVVSSESDGHFSFNELDGGTYFLEVSYLGYQTLHSDTVMLHDNENISLSLSLEPEDAFALSEIVVTSKRPKIIQTAEKLIVDVEHSPQVNSNVIDVVKKVPGLMVVNGQVRYAGISGITIFINGKPTKFLDLATLLKEMPAENISKVELIQQPGAEFDADGSGPILNIILKKNVNLGTQGSLKASIGYNDDLKYRTSAFLSSYQKNINFQLNASYAQNAWREDLTLTRTVDDDIYDQFSSSPYRPENRNINMGIDWYASDLHSLGINGQYTKSTNDYSSSIRTSIIGGSNDRSNLFTKDLNDKEWELFILSPYYEYNSLDDKHKLVIDYNYINRQSLDQNDLLQDGFSDVDYQNQRNIQDGEYIINTYKVDYSFAPTDKLKLNAGAKFDHTESDSDLRAFVENDGGQFVTEIGRSNHFLIEEDILGIYGKASYTLDDNWSFSAGLRWEESKTVGTSLTLDSIRRRDISKLFPSFSLQRKINEHLAANVAYSYRISRPAYSTLNPFVTYYDPYTLDRGNPRLQPSFTNSYRFNLSYDNQPFFNLEYKQTKDAIVEIITQNNESAEASRQKINVEDQQAITGYIGAPLDFIKPLSGHLAFGVNYVLNKTTDNVETPLDLSKWGWFIDMGASTELPWEITAEVYAGYLNGGLDGIIDFDWLGWMGLSFSKNVLDDRLKIKASLDEMITREFYGNVDYCNVDMKIISDWSRYSFNFEVAYNFGNRYKNNKSRSKASQDVLDRID